MAKRNVEKLILIGLGTANPRRIGELASRGAMPALASLIKRGTVAENCFAPYPTRPLTSWTSIVTGSWPGTHGVGLRSSHPLKATTLWEAAASQGNPSILVDCGVPRAGEDPPRIPSTSAALESPLPSCGKNAQGWAWPADVEKDLRDLRVFPPPKAIFKALRDPPQDQEECFRLAASAHSWYAAAVEHLMEAREWRLLLLHDPILSAIQRALPDFCDGVGAEISETVYRSLDDMIARITGAADRSTLVVLVSDHGVIPSRHRVDINKVLADAGLAAIKDDGAIDWGRTKAACVADVHVVVNLKHREPQGVVDPADYENVREQVINTLMDHVSPDTGKHPAAFVLRREDARVFGLYGDDVGDLVVCLEPGYGSEYAGHLPTAERGGGILRSFLLFAGPNVKKGSTLQRNAWLVDIAPSICHLMDIPFPPTMEGAILYQALQDPNFRLTEKSRLETNYKRLKRAYDAEISLTHTYNR